MWLQWLGAVDSSCGQKAFLLSEIARAGVQVPKTFVIPPSYFAAYLQENEVLGPITTLFNAKGALAADEIRQKILATPLTPDLQYGIIDFYDQMEPSQASVKAAFQMVGLAKENPMSCAVKSSYVFPSVIPFPKKQVTLLNASNKHEVVEAVKHCWASIFSAELLRLRIDRGLGLLDMNTSVLVQRMIYPRKSGTIIFSRGNRATIKAGFGLGEAIVSGMVQADEYEVDRDTLQIISVNKKAQQWRFSIRKGEGKIVKEELSPAEQELQTLSLEEIQQLLRVCKPVSGPLTVEWALEQDRFSIINVWPANVAYEPLVEHLPQAEISTESPVQQEVRPEEVLPEMSMVPESEQPITVRFLAAKELFAKSQHDASMVLVTLDMIIHSALKEKYAQIYGQEPQERFFELIGKLQEHIHIPESVGKIRLLRNKYLDQHKPIDLVQITDAMNTTKEFLEMLE